MCIFNTYFWKLLFLFQTTISERYIIVVVVVVDVVVDVIVVAVADGDDDGDAFVGICNITKRA